MAEDKLLGRQMLGLCLLALNQDIHAVLMSEQALLKPERDKCRFWLRVG